MPDRSRRVPKCGMKASDKAANDCKDIHGAIRRLNLKALKRFVPERHDRGQHAVQIRRTILLYKRPGRVPVLCLAE